MKIDARRNHPIFKLTKTEIEALRSILRPACREKESNPVSWLLRSRVARKLLKELTGAVDGALRSGNDPDDENGDDKFAGSLDDDDRLLSEAYRSAYRAGKGLGGPGARR